MSDPVEFKWDKKLIIRDNKNGDKVLETFPEDKLERVKYANFLTKFLADQGYDKETRDKHNYVLNLNSEWGSGKTYFLRRWAEDLKEHYPVVYVDAWKQDYSDDPLMTVISSMIKQLREQAGSAEDKAVIKASRKLFGLLKAAAPSAARSLTKRYLGIDPVTIMEAEEDDDQLGNATDENGNPIDMGLAASKVVEHLISEHDAKATAIESLKMSVEQWVAAVIGKDQTDDESKRTYPAFVFIDELDRCRPSYAVEMLETIKHIFDIPGVVFVVATDTEQLQHAVKAVYGEGFNARAYLGRFFSSRYTLKTLSYKGLIPIHCNVNILSAESLTKKNIRYWPETEDDEGSLENITNICEAFSLTPRQTIQITDRLISTISNLNDGDAINLVFLTSLLCANEKSQSLFDVMINETFSRHSDDTVLNKELLKATRVNTRYISFRFKPADYIRYHHGSGDIPKANVLSKYPEMTYSCTVYQAIKHMHPHFKAGSRDQASLNAYINEVEKNYNQYVNKIDDNDVWCHASKDQAKNWVSITCAIDNNVNRQSVHQYKDFVELASALDWHGLDENEEF